MPPLLRQRAPIRRPDRTVVVTGNVVADPRLWAAASAPEARPAGSGVDPTGDTTDRVGGLAGAVAAGISQLGRVSRFAAVGALGTVVNLAVMALLLGPLAANYVVAAIVAAEVSILHNFVLQERFVFKDLRDGAHGRFRRLAQHLVFNNAEALIRLPLLVLLVETVLVWPLLAQALTLAVAFLARFLFMSRVVYRPRRQPLTPAPLRETVEV